MDGLYRIDPHVHCRDGKQAYKETIEHAFKVANSQGVRIIFDMPNTDPPIVSQNGFFERLALVPDDQRDNYFIWMGSNISSGAGNKQFGLSKKVK